MTSLLRVSRSCVTCTYQELLLNLAQTVQTGLELEVVVGSGLGNGRDDGDPVALGADVVRG